MTLYQRIAAAGIPHANHESDLYVKNTIAARTIINACELEDGVSYNASAFWNPVEREIWIEIPFAYDPWWNERIKRP